MARKKKEQYPIGLCGTFFSTEFLEELKEEVLEEVNDKIELKDFYNEFIGKFNFKDYEHVKNFVMIHSKNVKFYDNEDLVDGYFIGVNIFDVPEHFSMKRIKIDVRNVMEQIGLIYKDEDPETIQIIPQIIEI